MKYFICFLSSLLLIPFLSVGQSTPSKSEIGTFLQSYLSSQGSFFEKTEDLGNELTKQSRTRIIISGVVVTDCMLSLRIMVELEEIYTKPGKNIGEGVYREPYYKSEFITQHTIYKLQMSEIISTELVSTSIMLAYRFRLDFTGIAFRAKNGAEPIEVIEFEADGKTQRSARKSGYVQVFVQDEAGAATLDAIQKLIMICKEGK